MKPAILAVLSCVWIFGVAVATVYLFPAPRAWAVHVLTGETVVQPRALQASVATALMSAASSSSVADPNAADTTTPQTPPTYQYKIVQSVDPCLLNQLGASGWVPLTYGGTLVLASGKDETCAHAGTFGSLDWAVFERPILTQ